MPNVAGKKYPYTAAGKAAAKKAAAKKPTAAHKKKIAAAAKKNPQAFKPVHLPAKRGR
jgi:hypothetical protein